MKHPIREFEETLANCSRPTAAINKRFPIAPQMGPADLPMFEAVVKGIAVTDDHAGEGLSQQGIGAGQIAFAADQEDGHGGGHARPQPSFAGLLFPGGFVGVGHGALAHMFVGFGDGLGQGGADLLLDTADRTQANGHIQGGGQEFFGLAFAKMIAAGAQTNEGLQTGTEGAIRDSVGELAACHFAAMRAAQQVLLIFADFGVDGRQLGDLVAQRQRIDAGQCSITVFAGIRNAGDGRFGEFFRGHHGAVGGRMVGLSAAFTSGGLFACL